MRSRLNLVGTLLLAGAVALGFWILTSMGSNVERTSTRIVERRDPQAMSDQVALEKEFEALAVYPDAEMTYYLSTSRSGGAAVTANYRLAAPISWSGLRAHYDAAFAAAQWKFDHEQPVTRWGRDVGQREAVYCRPPFTGTLADGLGDDGQVTDFGIYLGAGNMRFKKCGEHE